MNSNEITREIELPSKARTNIIHVNFNSSSTPQKRQMGKPKKKTTEKPSAKSNSSWQWMTWLKEIDFKTPWVLRLVAVISVLILSMLIL